MEENEPTINKIYSGVVVNIDHLGYKIQLTGFRQTYEGLIHKSLVADQALSNKLTRGRCVKVKITAVCETFVVISLDRIEEEIINESRGNKKQRSDEVDRDIRISSPERYQVKQMSGTFSNVNIRLKDEPLYLQMMKLSIGCSDTIKSGLFSSVVKIPEGLC